MGWFGPKTPAAVDGSLGLSFEVPADWTVREAKDTSCVFWTPMRDAVVFEHLPAGIIATEETLDALREDVRVATAVHRGGLVECDIVEGLGAFAVSKRPTAGPHGVDYVGLAQIPTSRGRVSVIVYAREGSPTGLREAVLFAATPGDDPFAGWFADPYGAPLPAMDEGERWALACKSDAPEHDASFANHPLSRVRAVLAAVRNVRVHPAAPDPRRRERHDMAGIRCELPPGFLALAGGTMRSGQVYVRNGFEARRDHLSVCRQPDFPDAGRSIAGARAMIEQHLEWSGQRPDGEPHLEATRFGGRDVIRGRWTATQRFPSGDRRLQIDGLYAPCGTDSFEVSCMFEIDGAARAEKALAHVVASLGGEAAS